MKEPVAGPEGGEMGVSHLEELQKKLTKDGNLELALQVRAEANRIQKSKPESKPETQTSNPSDQHKVAAPLLLAWDQSRPELLLDSDTRAALGCQFNHQGGNTISKDGTLSMAGGRTAIKGLNRKLLTSCKESQQWSLVLHFQTASLDQTGPAHMFSFSLNGYMRNFSLCQEKDQLVLRLRTTKTGENGTNPEVKLGSIKQGRLHRIAVTYQPDKLAFFMDGKAVPVKQISGDLSNWQEYQLVLGNEWKDDRPWKGEFSRFALYSSALSEDEAIALTK